MSPRQTFMLSIILSSFLTVLVILVSPSDATAQAPPLEEFIRACNEEPHNPWLVTARYVQGGEEDAQPALVAFRDTPDNGGHIALATAGQVGALYGLAYHGDTATIYAGAFHKRGTHFGPDGPGAVYAVDLRSGDIRRFATVPNAGQDYHSVAGNYHPDTRARFPAGKTSLGDLDINSEGTELAVVNLADRQIHRFSLSDGAHLGSFGHGASGSDWSGDARPFGVGYYDGRLYHGVVNSAESSDNRAQLRAVVYSSAADGSDMREEASGQLAFERGWIWPNSGEAIWNAWSDPPGQLHDTSGRYPMPILSDIVFNGAGDQMILGFRDRFGDMTFYTTPPNRPPPGEQIFNTPAGDILPAFGGGGGWRLQTTPEFYEGDYGPNRRGNHDETSYGGLVVVPGHDTVVMSANSPQVISSAGAVWLDTKSGADKGREQMYRFGQGHNFGKANGLGDLEVLCGTREEETPTPTVTNTVTPTLTATATDTVTPTVTSTVQATDTSTVTPTSTVVTTPTTGPSPTASETSVSTVTPTVPAEVTPQPTTPHATSPPKTSPPDTPAPPTPRITPPTDLPDMPRTGGQMTPWGMWLIAAGVLVLLLGAVVRRRRAVAARRGVRDPRT